MLHKNVRSSIIKISFQSVVLVLASASVAIACATLHSNNFTPEFQDRFGCTFYQNHDYTGSRVAMSAGVRECRVPSFSVFNFNDVASSVRLSPGCSVAYYQHDNFAGWKIERSENEPRFRKSGGSTLDRIGQLGRSTKVNDSVSSAVCFCGT